jgi:hypothetical protein
MRCRLLSVAVPVPSAARRPRWLRAGAQGVVAAGLVVALGAAGLPVVAASAARPAGPVPMPVTAVRQGTVTSVPLVTGGQAVMTAAGGQRSLLLRGASGAGAAVWYQNATGDRFIVPAVAVPYVGRELGSSLFDVSALARDRITGQARIPVRLRFAAGAKVVPPPGVRLTWARGETARGYVTASSGRFFAAALAGQDRANTVRGHLRHARWLFGGLAEMTLAAPGAPAPARPDYPLHVLRLKVTDETGKPANNGDVVLLNTDNRRRVVIDEPVVNGMVRVAVPAGDYSALGTFFDTATRFVVLGDFRVPASPAATTVTMAERSATSAVSVTVPRPTTWIDLQEVFYRVAAAGGGTLAGLLDSAPAGLSPVYVSPQPAPKVGRLRYLTQWLGKASGGHWYDTAFAYPDIPADEHFVARSSQLATVHEHLFGDPASHGSGSFCVNPYDIAAGSVGAHSPGLLVNTGCLPAAVPGSLTVSVGTASGDQWIQDDYTASPGQLALAADPRVFLPGHSYSVQWAHGPLAPVLGQHTGPWRCQACTAGSVLALGLSPFGDSEPDHFAAPIQDPRFGASLRSRLRFTLYRDGIKLVSARGATGAVVPGIPAQRSVYRAVLDVRLAGLRGFSQSTRTHTDLTVPYVPGGGAVLPRGDTCPGGSAASPCRVLPALTLGYQLATNQDNTSSAPVQVLHLRARHVSYTGAGSQAPITSAAVWVSFDGGKSWQRARVTGSGGTYTASWPNPASAAGTSPEIKVTAADAIGGSITQTITSAYTIATTSQHRSPR